MNFTADKTQTLSHIEPKIGEGVFLIKDVAYILKLDYNKVRRWIFEFWDCRFGHNETYTFGDKGFKAVNFYTLIEFYTFYKLRELDFSAQKIQEAHELMSKDLNTKYPFAQDIIHVDNKNIWYEHLGDLMKVDKTRKRYFKDILEPFLNRIEFGKDRIAQKYYPLTNSKNIVVDPKHQFGQPTVSGTNIKTTTIYNLHKGGETNKNISILYNISTEKVHDAIAFHTQRVA